MAIPVLALLILAFAACAKGTLSEQGAGSAGGGALPQVKLSPISPTSTQAVNNLVLTVMRGEGGFDVTVGADAGMAGLDEMFFSLDYDAALNHAGGLSVDAAGAGDSVIALALEVQPGRIDYGIAATAGAGGPAVAAGDPLLSFRLVNGAALRVASAAGTGGQSRARNLELGQNDEEKWVLSWDYTNPGDTNQDGEVGIQDLTPIGRHYLETVENSWDDPLRHIDGDHNGEINLGDLTPLGRNYESVIFAYQIEMSEDGESGFITVGQLLLGEQEIEPGVAVRFEYVFGAQYVPGAWYRVVPLDNNLQFAAPSEAISEAGRRLDQIPAEAGDSLIVTITANGLPRPIAQLNTVRVLYPDTFSYVKDSANLGSVGGSREHVDGIWSSFATLVLFPPEAFILEGERGDGMKYVDFNVTVLEGLLPAAPAGFGDLLNFKLESSGNAPLSLEYVVESEDGLKRTYYTDENSEEVYFGNSIGFQVL
ncbi:hypothetical protein IIA79_08600 [bacterium]|nr:hypothetical protein [bacterium]